MFTAKATWGARTGLLSLNGKELATPNFVVATTRGAVPHVTPDELSTKLVGVFAEEMWDQYGLVSSCVDREALPFSADFVIAAARSPFSKPVTSKPNTDTALAIDTVQGSRLAPVAAIMKFMSLIRADLFVVPYDVPAQTTGNKVGNNRMRKMAVRSLDWLEKFSETRPAGTLLVGQLPAELATQEYFDNFDQLCSAYSFPNSRAPVFANASKLRVSQKSLKSWQDVYKEIQNGADLVYVPLTEYADAGTALITGGACIDLKDPKYAVDQSELGSTGHSLAYIHHLLNAEEMTASVLLQLHNHAFITELFAEIRQSITSGTFEQDFGCADSQ